MSPERTLGALDYLAGAAELAIIVAALAFAAYRLRRRFLPDWSGAEARVAEATAGLTLAIVLAQLLGTFGLFAEWPFLIATVLAAATTAALTRAATPRGAASVAETRAIRGQEQPERAGAAWGYWVAAIVCAAVFASWAIPTLTGVAGGMGRADSLWYHMPLAQRFLETGSLGELYFFDPIFFAHFYPANSAVLHAIPLLTFERDFLSPLLNLGFLALALLAAWAIGRPFGVAPQALAGAAVVLGAETMVDFQGGEALNDIVGVAFLLCAAALLANGQARGPGSAPREALCGTDARSQRRAGSPGLSGGETRVPRPASAPSREAMSAPRAPRLAALAFAGAAAGLAAGTKLSFLAPAAFLTVAVIVLAPRGIRLRATAAWSVPLALAGGYWYLRNLAAIGNPLPFIKWGPLDLASPERGFELRPGHSVAHYWNDTQIWSDWFIPYLAEELGPFWPLILLAVVGGGIYAVWRGGSPVLRALGAVAVLTAIAYVFTPLTAAGEEGEPISFEWNIRYLAPAVAVGLALLPCLPVLRATERRRRMTLAALGLVALITTFTIAHWPDGGHTKGGVATGFLVLGLFAAVWFLHRRRLLGSAAPLTSNAGVAALVCLAALAAGFLVQRHYLERRYENLSPQLNIAEAVRWAQDRRDERIAISGVRGVFNQYAFSGTDLSNRVQWLGLRGEDDAYLRIPDCATWRQALNDGDYTYVVTMYDPYDPGALTDTKEGLWTRADDATETVLRDGAVGVYRVTAELDPAACGALPDLEPAELNGDSVNLEPLANQPPPGARP